MTAFPCCTCPEPPGYDAEVDDPLPKYRNKCGCPDATLICVSAQKDATLCGFSEYADAGADPAIVASVPPKKYKIKTASGTRSLAIASPNACQGGGGGRPASQSRSTTLSGTQSYDEACVLTNSCEAEFSRSSPGCSYTFPDTGNTNERDPYNYNLNCDYTPDGVPGIGDIIESSICGSLSSGPGTWQISSAILKELPSPDNFVNYTFTGAHQLVISAEDTEAVALTRATETAGTDCTSIYELRTTSFSLTVRTVKFSLELTNLCYGRAYEGCVRIRKRKAFSGTVPDGEVVEWEDVEPFTFGPITPSAANTTDGITTTAEITDQTLVGGTVDAIGWEYQLKSVHVWPVSAGCDCPTDYEEPPPE